MLLTKDQIAASLPHDGAMVLLDSVSGFDSRSIVCSSMSHLDESNPLRIGGDLSVFAGVEYAAQAMALHRALTVKAGMEAGLESEARQGVVAVASKLEAGMTYLDECLGAIDINVSLLDEMGDSSQYVFSIVSDSKMCLSGRLLVSLL